MANITQVTIDTKKLEALKRGLEPKAMLILDQTAFKIEARAKPKTNYDTGAMRSSIYVSGSSGAGTTYSSATSQAQARNKKARLAQEVKAVNKFQRVIGASVEYAYWQEVKHKAFLQPAVQETRTEFNAAWKALADA